MTARELQASLVEDLQELFKNRMYSDPAGERQHISVVKQNLPKRESDEDEDPFPYIIVRLDSGGVDSQTDPHKVAVILLVGIYNDSPQNNGHEEVLEILEVIQSHYESQPLGSIGFHMVDPFGWVLQDEESWPYFFGAANLTFAGTAPRRAWSDLT